MVFLKYLCLLVAIVYGYSNTAKAFRGQGVTSPQMWLMGLGIVGYLLLEFELGY